MSENQSLVPQGRPSYELMRPLVSPADMVKLHREMVEFVKQALVDGVDYGIIPGTDKPTMFKPGAERTYIACGCYPRYSIIDSEIDHDREVPWLKRKKRFEGKRFMGWDEERGTSIGLYRYVTKCELVRRADGQVIAEGIGSASTLESRYIDRPRDCENTVAKMAQKRAMVAATLNGFGLSGMFTQDMEDFETDHGNDQGERRSGNGGKRGAEKPASKSLATPEQVTKLAAWAADDRVPEKLRTWLAGKLKQAKKAGLAAETATKWIAQMLQKVPSLGEAEQPPPEPETETEAEPAALDDDIPTDETDAAQRDREPGEEG